MEFLERSFLSFLSLSLALGDLNNELPLDLLRFAPPRFAYYNAQHLDQLVLLDYFHYFADLVRVVFLLVDVL